MATFFPFVPMQAIRSRLLSDATLVTAVQTVAVGAVADDLQLASGSKPVVLITQVAGNFDLSTFTNNIADGEYQVSVYDHRSNGTNAMQTVLGRVWGDSSGTDNTPTYGLARWTMTGSSIEDAFVEPSTYGVQDDRNTLHHFLTFNVRVTEA